MQGVDRPQVPPPPGKVAVGVASEAGVLSQAPGPHQERCRCEVDRRFGCAERLHVVLIYGHLRPIKRTIISVEFLEGVGAVCWTQDHTADNARSRRTGRTLGSRTPKHWNAARSSIERAGQVGHLVLDAVRKRCAIANDKRRAPGVCAQNVGQPPLGVGVVALLMRDVKGFAGHDRKARPVRSTVARIPLVAEAPGIRAGLLDGVGYLSEKLYANARFGDG